MGKKGIILIISILFAFIVGFLILNPLKQKPVASVVISSYNMASTLPAAIDSVLNQTVSNFELIVIDDGSTDNTKNVLKQYQKKDSRIHVIENEKNLGLIKSLQKGLAQAQGKYIIRMDADDQSYPDRIERQMKFMDQYTLDLSGAQLDTEKRKYKPGDWVSPDAMDSTELNFHLLFYNILAHPTVIIRSSFLKRNSLSYNEEYPNAEDYNLWVQVMMKGGRIAIMGGAPVVTYHSTGHGADWWKISDESVLKTRKVALREIAPNITDKMLKLPMCDLLQHIIEGNKETNFLNAEKLSEFELQTCLPKLTFKHPNWEDSFTHMEQNRFKRKSVEDYAYVSRIKDKIEIKWDNWPVEYFKCTKGICKVME